MPTPRYPATTSRRLLALLAAACAGPPADAPSATMADYRAAREAVDRGLAALGSIEGSAHPPFAFFASGTMNAGAERQGRTPDDPSPGRLMEGVAVDLPGNRTAFDFRHERFDGTAEWLRELYVEPGRQLLVIPDGGLVFNLESAVLAAGRDKARRRYPQLLVRELLASPAALRSGPSTTSHDVVHGRLTGGEPVTAFFDRRSGFLSAVEFLTDVQSFGDAVVRWEFGDYEPTADGQAVLPKSYRVYVSGRLHIDMRVDSVVFGDAAAALFELPAGVVRPDPVVVPASADASADAEVREVAPGVYLAVNLRGGFHPMFVEFEDFVVAVDAPAGYRLLYELPAGDVAPGPSAAWLSDRYLELIRDAVPDKPVRHVVLTHFHNDHAGGVRSFVAAGATVLAAATDTAAVRALVEAPHTVAPDALIRSPRPLVMETVDREREISDGTRTLRIVPTGPNPHTEELLVLHLPNEGIVYVTDLFEPTSPTEFPNPGHAPLDRWFVSWLAERDWEYDWIYAMHGAGRMRRRDIEGLR